MIDETNSENVEFNWPAFYRALIYVAPCAMTGLPDGGREYIRTLGLATDAFWSDDLQDATIALWEESPAAAVNEAMEIFCENVRREFAELPRLIVDERTSVPSADPTFTLDGCIDCIDFKLTPDGHFKFPHLWPLKLPQAGRSDYGFPDPV